jgi:hypothetical protein
LEALYATEGFDWYSVGFSGEALYETYLMKEDYSQDYYGYLATFDESF